MTLDARGEEQSGFSVARGHGRYLREAYHGERYATRVLVPEAFEPTPRLDVDEEGSVRILAWVLRNRLRAALSTARARALRVYGERLGTDAPAAGAPSARGTRARR
ncbi:MAG: hypothetical protein O3C25_00060 [Chloroflexi bacterium]|nr:hypothetical protein [Chloroflexota bacterium]